MACTRSSTSLRSASISTLPSGSPRSGMVAVTPTGPRAKVPRSMPSFWRCSPSSVVSITADCLKSGAGPRSHTSFEGMPEILTGPLALNTPFSTVRSMSPSAMSMPGKRVLQGGVGELCRDVDHDAVLGHVLDQRQAELHLQLGVGGELRCVEAGVADEVEGRLVEIFDQGLGLGLDVEVEFGERLDAPECRARAWCRRRAVPCAPEGITTSAPSTFRRKSLSLRLASPEAPMSGGRSLK